MKAAIDQISANPRPGIESRSLMVNESPLPLAAGMQLSAEIIEGKRTVLQYLLSPVQRVVSEAGMER